ncbi:LOW QUALITY PROTEIN: hypothetical protein PHMEG_0003121 [Phytophthora megakarya]|uniref:Uncharacterized protein n=1 Tax=Phytophthora megakarya TaxID=4795 RepID=A0A225WYX4_9STRA|nr:LOW QUALITY PROTEIN: hypothetical protein PHMEG_0003121 [Phytophthora megakarya]
MYMLPTNGNVSNVVTDPEGEASKFVTLMKGLKNRFAKQKANVSHLPKSQLEFWFTTDPIMKAEKHAQIRRFSYKHRVFVEKLLVFDLDDKFGKVLACPGLHDRILTSPGRSVQLCASDAARNRER